MCPHSKWVRRKPPPGFAQEESVLARDGVECSDVTACKDVLTTTREVKSKMAIGATEWEDFFAVLKKHGYWETDFELSMVEHPLPAGGVAPVRGEVTVCHKTSGIVRRYACGHGTAWVVEFEGDVVAGVYR